MSTPDISSLTSASEVFSSTYTLPQIRVIHKTLHSQLEEKTARLRTQVGGSYRELLGTADTIVRMKTDNDTVQDVLGRMATRCGRSKVGDKVMGMTKFVAERKTDEDAVGARVKLLEACALVVSRVLRGKGEEGLGRGERLILGTKIWVVGRLLVKGLGGGVEDLTLRKAVEAAKKSLGLSRRKLEGCIAKVLEKGDETTSQADMLKTLAAYSLATNSGARDVLRYFLRVRANAMVLAFEVEETERERSVDDVVTALNIYTRTLLDVQALVPFKLAEALDSLKKHPLLADASLNRLEGLRLDVYKRWCGDDALFFTPYIRHDDLDGKAAREMLSSWAETRGEVLLQGLAKTLERMNEFKAITDLRTRVLQLWIREGGRARGFDPSEMLHNLRQAMNGRLLDVLETKVNKLNLVGSEVSATLESWKEDVTDQLPDLWDESTYDIGMSGGAASFVHEVVARMFGRNDVVSKAATCYSSWRRVIDDVGEVVEQLRKQRWENDYDEIEDEGTIEARERSLSKDDPKALHDRLQITLEKAFKSLDERIAALWASREASPNAGRVAMYFVRVIRDIRSGLPKLASVERFGLGIVPALHDKIAREVIVAPLDEYVTTAIGRRSVIGRALWEGKPELPSQPTSGTVRFLRDLTDAMGKAGMDLWSPTAVRVLKGVLRKQLCDAWHEGIVARAAATATEEGAERDTDDGDEESKTNREEREEAEKVTIDYKDLFVQWLYDILYLKSCLGVADAEKGDEFKRLEEDVLQKSGLEDEGQKQRIVKSSQDYWKRTSLLFGILA